MKHLLSKSLPFLFLATLVLLLSWRAPGFATMGNIGDILRYTAVFVIMGVGMTFVIVSGGIDLSVGSVLAFSSVVAAWSMRSLMPVMVRLSGGEAATPLAVGVAIALSILVGMATGAAWGVLNGLLITRVKVPPFIATLATMGMARGFAHLLAHTIAGGGTTIEITQKGFKLLGGADIPVLFPTLLPFAVAGVWANYRFGKRLRAASRRLDHLVAVATGLVVVCALWVIPAPTYRLLVAALGEGVGAILRPLVLIPVPAVVMVAVVLMGYYMLNHMRVGRYAFAIGSNVEAARYSGIRVERYTLYVYLLLGVLSGLAGMIEASMLGAGDSTLGDAYELRTIAAVVIGGASLSGGQGTIIGTLIGALIMGVIKDGCILLNISFFWQLVVISLLIIVAVAFDTYQRRRTGS